MFGYTDAEIPNEPHIWKDYVHPDDLAKAEKDFNTHLQSKGKIPYSNELRYVHKDGSIVWVYCKGAVIEWTDEGVPVRMVGCHVDITPLKKALELVDAQKNELQSQNKDLEQFASIVSHDLKEPLRTIINFIEIYKKEFPLNNNENRAIEYLNIVENASIRMSSLIDALLKYTTIGKTNDLQITDLNVLLNSLIKGDLRLVMEENNVAYKVNKLPKLKVYPTELRVLFQNLITNAIKFSKTDKTPYFEITATKNAAEWHFKFEDHGIGIAKEHFERIFIIFKRIPSMKEIQGDGIGLAQCKRVINLHKGKIWVESEENVGSSFNFTIPII